MKRLIVLVCLLLSAAPAAAQQGAFGPGPYTPIQQPPMWNPTADYVTPGQDERGYRNWYMASPRHGAQISAFNQYLTTWGVGGVVPTWQLLRTASMWQRCGASPFEVPPTSQWPNLVQTLRYVRDYVIPAVGPVEPVSAYRNPILNACAGGAPQSSHQHFQAVDLVPLRPISREQLMRSLCMVHIHDGSPYQVGLGFYAYLRFHIDSMRFRKWGVQDSAGASPCHATIAQRPPPAASAVPQAEPLVAIPNGSAPTAGPTAAPVDPLAPISNPPAVQQ